MNNYTINLEIICNFIIEVINVKSNRAHVFYLFFYFLLIEMCLRQLMIQQSDKSM